MSYDQNLLLRLILCHKERRHLYDWLVSTKSGRWRGSIYKLVWLDLLVFLLIYYFLNLTYRLLLDEEAKRTFEGVVNYCSFHGNVIPLSFVLGFYVTVVMNRWWNQYTTIPWPDSIAVFVSATIHGQDERGRLMRRTIVRYVCLCLTMVLTMISPRVKKRFPTNSNFVEAGLLLENEKTIMENLNNKFPKPSKHWLPIVWATSIVTRARKEGRIRDDFAVKTIIDELNKFRGQAGLLLSYDTISVPLVYTQVVTIAVYSYFITSALGSQWIDNKRQSHSETVYISNIDLYFPIFSTLEFFFYMGWLKVAESLINPFGEDDDDFEVNWLIDRDLQVSYMIVDEMHHEHPELIKDQYWDEVFPTELPYTIATENQREEHPEPSTARVAVPVRQRSMVTVAPSSVKIDEMVPSNTVSYKFAPPEQLQMNDDAQSGIHFIVSRGSKRGKKEDRNSMGSTNSMTSLQQTPMSRVASVTSMLKRLFSKEEQRQAAGQVASQPDGVSSSNPALNKPTATSGSMKIANEVIEEVDEQATITSMRQRPENRPTAMSLFNQNHVNPSEPVNVPSRNSNHSNTRLSSSAPTNWSRADDGSPAAASLSAGSSPSLAGARARLDSDVGAELSAAGSNTLLDEVDGSEDPDADEFERLRCKREQDRHEKYLQKLMAARSVSAQQPTGSVELIDNDLLLEDLLAQSAASRQKEISNSEKKDT
ncbi:bestrophin homolog 18-like isoform X2 [Plodia interpunctella]|uniref:bestrophin homolog 18-like isoform X2 n=1 Tax=Plodia interpunctella TaxID=58824 RepID=UPI002368559D|nr:bestrophin homolog 18-like isoform X2 [Plodia interpunctella]